MITLTLSFKRQRSKFIYNTIPRAWTIYKRTMYNTQKMYTVNKQRLSNTYMMCATQNRNLH